MVLLVFILQRKQRQFVVLWENSSYLLLLSINISENNHLEMCHCFTTMRSLWLKCSFKKENYPHYDPDLASSKCVVEI
jgi:hypothetical protein